MFKPEKILACALVAVAGCSSAPPRAGKHALNWDAAELQRPPGLLQTRRVAEPPLLAPPPGTLPPMELPHTNNSYATAWIPLKRWSHDNGVGSVQRISGGTLPTFLLKTTNGTLIVRADSQVASWNGLELHLGFAPQLIDEQPFVHALDLAKSIQPLLRDFAAPAKTNRVIVIDPGHGGQNTGTRSVVDGTFEKQFTLDWAKRLAALLAEEGWQVFLTRTEDVDVSLADRVAFGEAHNADLFISLHFNATGSPANEQAGLETYCLTPRGMPSTLTRGYDDDVSLQFPNNAFDADNWRLAFHVQRALLDASGASDHGVRRARFMGVLRGNNRPAVLVEGGYLSNAREARLIADPEYRQKLAEAVAGALKPKEQAMTGAPESGE